MGEAEGKKIDDQIKVAVNFLAIVYHYFREDMTSEEIASAVTSEFYGMCKRHRKGQSLVEAASVVKEVVARCAEVIMESEKGLDKPE